MAKQGDKGITWTNETRSPIVGCSKISEACDNCWAIGEANRLACNPNPKIARAYAGLAANIDGRLQWTGLVRCLPERLTDLLKASNQEMMTFMPSMSDPFHEDVPEEFLDLMFGAMAIAGRRTYQILTKRPDRMARYLNAEHRWAFVEGAAQHLYSQLHPEDKDVDLWLAVPEMPPNIWLGITAETERHLHLRFQHLMQCEARVRFVSIEPMLGPFTHLHRYFDLHICADCGKRCFHFERPLDPKRNHVCSDCGSPYCADDEPRLLHWILAGGETGVRARPLHPDWVRDAKEQCAAASVPFHFKGWGEWTEVPAVSQTGDRILMAIEDDSSPHMRPCVMRRIGKKQTGRQINGREWLEFPRTAQ